MVFVTLETTQGAIQKRAHPISWRIESSLEFNTLFLIGRFLRRGPADVFLNRIFSRVYEKLAHAAVS